MAKKQHNQHAREIQSTTDIAENHHPLAIPAIDQRSHNQAEQYIGQRANAAHQADQRRRVRNIPDQQRVRGLGDGFAQRGNRLATPEQHKVAITPEDRAAHSSGVLPDNARFHESSPSSLVGTPEALLDTCMYGGDLKMPKNTP